MNAYGYREGINAPWELLHPKMKMENLGYIPGWLFLDDPRPAKEQLDTAYISGWQPFTGFNMDTIGNLYYPGDPIMMPLAKCQLRDETVYFYQSSWVAIRQRDDTFEVARMD